MKRIKSIFVAALCLCVGCSVLASCAPANNEGDYIVTAIARTEGSGTRSAFDELVVHSAKGALKDVPVFSESVLTADTTGQVVTAVNLNGTTLGYISLGSVAANADRIKAISVNGVEASTENVVNGSYELSRPFNLVYPSYDALSDAAKNFLSFIRSEQGREITGAEYIAYGDAAEYTPYQGSAAEVTLGGSTSVGPLMTQLATAYMEINGNVTVTVTGGGSGTGVSGAGTNFMIGMASREITATERQTREVLRIATDGIAVIVRRDCTLADVTFDQLYDLYTEGSRIECR